MLDQNVIQLEEMVIAFIFRPENFSQTNEIMKTLIACNWNEYFEGIKSSSHNQLKLENRNFKVKLRTTKIGMFTIESTLGGEL